MAVMFLFLQAGNPSPLSVIREKRFYKTGAAAQNTSLVEWLKKPTWGKGSSESRVVRRSAALQVIRDQKYKEKEARMNAQRLTEQAHSERE
jgi:hypothetical protein